MKGWRGRIGILYPASGLVDDEFYRLAPAGVSVHVHRVPVPSAVTAGGVKTFSEIDNLINFAKDLALVRPTCVAWACTSGSFLVGVEGSRHQVAALERSLGTPFTNTSQAMVRALKHLGVKRLGVGTPYPSEFNAPIAKFLEDNDFQVVSLHNLGLNSDWEIGSATPEDIYALARRVAVDRAQAVFLACTGLGAIDLVGTLERDLGRPVLTANQVTMWHALGLSGINTTSLEQFGSLFAEAAAKDLAAAASRQ